MRIIGDNRAGFENEHNIQKALDQKIYENINPNLRHFLDEIFHHQDLRGKWVHAQVMNVNMKPDFYVTVDGVLGGAYVSVKIGSGNSIHQEPFLNFVDFLKDNGATDEIITNLKLFHFADGTTNNTGTLRQTAGQFIKENQGVIQSLNEFFNKREVLRKIIERVIFQGNYPNAPQADYIYHGDEHNGVWASKDEIFQYLSLLKPKTNSVHAGPLTYQNWNRDIEFKGTKKNGRMQMQFKWGDLKNTLFFITARRQEFVQSGTYEGELSEKSSVIAFNRNPESLIFKDYLSSINMKPEAVLLIRVTTKQLSKLSNQKVNTRADAYAIEILDNRIFDILEENDYYLDEEILNGFNEYYNCVEKSGISIKKDNSDNYTLIKLTPNSFNELFGSYELGYGASIFCKRSSELHYNIPLLDGWKTTIEDLQDYFDSDDITGNSLVFSLELCQKIKEFSIARIKSCIDNSPRLQLIIFNGKDIYDEPYSAYFFMQNNQVRVLGYMPYNVTTGSGRSHGDYSIILKPKTNMQI